MELIYHIPDDSNYTESIFDNTIKKYFRGKSVKIMSPYLSFSYLRRLDWLTKSKWQLLTDVNALISSLSKHSYSAFSEYLLKNHNKIHHHSGPHAKTIISKNHAFLGSANFTAAGIKSNNELSVLISEMKKVQEKIYYQQEKKADNT